MIATNFEILTVANLRADPSSMAVMFSMTVSLVVLVTTASLAVLAMIPSLVMAVTTKLLVVLVMNPISGGAGGDRLTGGAGSDLFIFKALQTSAFGVNPTQGTTHKL